MLKLMVEPFQNVHSPAIITWVFDIYQAEKAYLKEIIKHKRLALIVKELIDDEGQKILDRLGLCVSTLINYPSMAILLHIY